MEQKPSIGRMVHYVAYGTPGGEYAAGAHRAAIITEVYEKGNMPPSGNVIQLDADGHCTSVGLIIFNPTGHHWRQSVPYDDSPTPKPGTWHWPERV